MPTSPHKLIEELQATRSLKVWSLIITFFGDAVEPRGGVIAASTLQTVMKVMGVGSGAVRTACSRLAKDGWIERQKQGRNSFYRLSDMGHTPFKKASRQIYATPITDSATSETSIALASAPRQTSGKFTLVMQNPLNVNSSAWLSLRDRGIRINGNCTLFESDDPAIQTRLTDTPETDDMLVLSDASASFPDWIKRSVCSEENARRYHQLMQRFESIPDNLPTDPLTSLAIRCLLIHEWRRLLLRSTAVPSELVPADWPRDTCHHFVASLYRQLFATGEQWMDDHALGPNGPLKTTDHSSGQRFSGSDSRNT